MAHINNRKRLLQIVDFSGLRYKTMTPTDLDFYLEYDNKLYIFGEFKSGNTPIPYGQMLGLTRLIDNLVKPAVFFIAEHDIENTMTDVMADKCKVRRYYTKEQWHMPKRGLTVKKLCDRFITQVNKKANETLIREGV